MRKNKIKKSLGSTLFLKGRGLPKGCEYCLQGAKVVLFLNGICQKPSHCAYYCPISEERRGKNITFADEIEIETNEGLLDEINKIHAKGMSITGGEPLFGENLQKTIEYITFVKAVKGPKFHIHLYTNGENFTEQIAEKLSSAGLDEIRFHPSKDNWSVIENALGKNIVVGAEVPVIPDEKEIKKLQSFILYLDHIGAEFINLNEFECCFPNSQNLKDRGYYLEKGSIASVEGSKKAALNLIQTLTNKVSLQLHFCPIIAKDYFQLKSRYLRRARTIKLPFEEITEEGLLLFAQIEGNSQNLVNLYHSLIKDGYISENRIHLEGELLKLPYLLALEDVFQKYLDIYNLRGYIIEIIPFRGKYCQITEKTPISVYKSELKGYADY